MTALEPLPLPDILATAARSMAPAYLRRRLVRVGTPYTVGRTTTFAYVGDAKAVRVVHFMARFPRIPDMERLGGSDLWHVTVELPERSRLEYKIEVTREGRTDRIVDPLNRRTASDPFGSNSVAHGPGYVDPAWANPSPEAAAGTVEAFDVPSAAFGDERTLSVYLPDGFPDGGPYPLAVLHDGSDLIEYASVDTVLDNLIGTGSVAPLVAVLLDPIDRNHEYAGDPRHTRFVLDEVLTHADRKLHVATDPGLRILGGCSLGAVATLATAAAQPGSFSSLMMLSGSFVTSLGGPWGRTGPVFERVVATMDAFFDSPVRPADRAWMACGAYEGLAADNRALVPALREKGMDVHYEEPPDGHHWVGWRNSIGTALQALLPGHASEPEAPASTVGV